MSDILRSARALGVIISASFCWGMTAQAEVAAVAATDPQGIRIAVAQHQPRVDLAIQGRFRIMSLHASEALREGPQLSTVSVQANPQGILVGEQLFPFAAVRVEPARDASITLNGQRLRGTVEIRRESDSSLLVINRVGLEDYLRGVVAKEAPFYWPAEALRAVAIVARTYTLFKRLSNVAGEYDVTADVLSQVYGGKTAERGPTNQAVNETEGLVLLYHGQVFPAFYSSTCGGMTERASVMGPFDLEPLRGHVACSFCVGSPFYRWQRHLTNEDLAWAVKQQGRGSISPVEGFEVASYTDTGRVASVRLRGATRTLLLTGHEFRQWLGFERIRSTAFAIVPDGQGFLVQGRGWGHGVGLCQWGAADLARRGLSAQEILAFYYPGAVVVRLGETLIQPIPVQGGSL